MIQKNIRDYEDQTYTIEEGSELVTELNERTKHDVDGYNSIRELGTKLKNIEETYLSSKQVFVLSDAQKNFELTNVPNSVDVWVDRIYQIEGVDYDLDGDFVRFYENIGANSIVTIRKF